MDTFRQLFIRLGQILLRWGKRVQTRAPRILSHLMLRRALRGLVAFTILGAVLLIWAWNATPSVTGLRAWVQRQDSLRHTTYVSFTDISPLVSKALIASEDERFYQHHGVDIVGVLRAALDDLRAGQLVEGGSTLTAQLAKNAYLHGYDHMPQLKLEDLLLAVKIEQHYPKASILEMYLNLVYFGEGAYGIAAAARHYFQRVPAQLDLAESALLAGLVRSPGASDPWCHPALAKDRQQTVLARMLDEAFITSVQARDASAEPFPFWQSGTSRTHTDICGS